jgi:hypothetical protein
MPAGHSPGQGNCDATVAMQDAPPLPALRSCPCRPPSEIPTLSLSRALSPHQKFPRRPASLAVDEIDPNFPCPALSVDPVSRDNVRHSSGATSSCSCQTTTARTSREALESSRRRARTRRISSRPGTSGSGYEVLRPGLLSRRSGTPSSLLAPQRRDAFIRLARLPIQAMAGVSRLKPCALGIHARYPSLASDTRCALPCLTSAPAKAFEPVRALLTGLLLAIASCRIWPYPVELAPPTSPEGGKASRTGLSADCVPQAPSRLTHLVSSQWRHACRVSFMPSTKRATQRLVATLAAQRASHPILRQNAVLFGCRGLLLIDVPRLGNEVNQG